MECCWYAWRSMGRAGGAQYAHHSGEGVLFKKLTSLHTQEFKGLLSGSNSVGTGRGWQQTSGDLLDNVRCAKKPSQADSNRPKGEGDCTQEGRGRRWLWIWWAPCLRLRGGTNGSWYSQTTLQNGRMHLPCQMPQLRQLPRLWRKRCSATLGSLNNSIRIRELNLKES